MTTEKIQLQAVPTNVITGFLGVGKTTAILNLLKNKPDNERWAVLVNEFGEIGVDGSLFEGQHSQQQGVFIREVPGGCMCCTSGLPMQIALNQLLSKAKPDRLLIEPTGLGHPKEVLEVLTSEYYQDVLSLHKTLTIVDARKLKQQRYTDHDTFNQQIALADMVVGNKTDLYESKDKARLSDYVKQYAQPDIFYKKPIDVVTAKFFGGQNFIKGTSKNNNFSSNIGKLALPKDCLQGNGILTFRPENVQIGKGPKSVNTIKAKIIEKIFLGTQTRLKLSIKDEVIQAIANPNEVDEKETGIEIDINIPPSCLWVVNN